MTDSFRSNYARPRAYEDDVYQWNLGRMRETLGLGEKAVLNPALRHAIFVVHGMGTQAWTDTAAELRTGFEDRLEDTGYLSIPLRREDIPPPFIEEGYWANYDNLEETFPEDFRLLSEGGKDLFTAMWKKRSSSVVRTYFWLWRQLLRLANPASNLRINFQSRFIYLLLFVIALPLLPLLRLFFPKVLSQVLADVRLYADPEGIIERAIVQRIDRRVGEAFLQMIGLGWDFRPLAAGNKIQRNGAPVEFDRIIWVAHSLGTVISYNVLSDLFQRASEFESKGNEDQKSGVKKFRTSLRRFVTLGSPLDKIAYLFARETLRPWPERERSELLEGGEKVTGDGNSMRREWWINFYHVLDPVSGVLSSPLICGDLPPISYHIGWWKWAGLAHTAYWKDKETIRFILSRTYGKEFLPLDPPKHRSAAQLTLFAAVGYLTWLLILLLLAILTVWCGIRIGALF